MRIKTLSHVFLWILGVFCLAATGVTAKNSDRPIELILDATEAPRRLLHTVMKIPVHPGPLTLFYPQWIPGQHSPNGPINDLANLKLVAGGKDLAWQRDPIDLFSFHCEVPSHVDTLDVTFDYLGASAKDGDGLGMSSPNMTSQLMILNWYLVLLYPKGPDVRDQKVEAKITLPEGWKLGTALPIEKNRGNRTQFKAATIDTLADSPVLAGKYFAEIPIGPKSGPPHFLILAGDSAAAIAIPPELKAKYDNLVVEAKALFKSQHYRSYRFLITLSDAISPNAVEHQESSDNRMPERFFIDDSFRNFSLTWYTPHEFVHSWNGKYRRPEAMTTSNFQTPLRTDLIWVYEGLTHYLGYLLTGRSGFYSPEISKENYALVVEAMRSQKGREWRSLGDTSVSAPILYFSRPDWASRRRSVDFYDEGALLWLDVDTFIREKSGGKRSLEDFLRLFFGGSETGAQRGKPYNFKDVVAALNEVLANDWTKFFEIRLNSRERAPLDGISRSGWKLVYHDSPGDLVKAHETEDKAQNYIPSLGFIVKEDGTIVDVVPGTLADKADVGPGMKVLGVNDRHFTPDRLREALTTSKTSKKPLRLLLENQDYFQNASLDYYAGNRYPFLERDKSRPDLLTEIFNPLVPRAGGTKSAK